MFVQKCVAIVHHVCQGGVVFYRYVAHICLKAVAIEADVEPFACFVVAFYGDYFAIVGIFKLKRHGLVSEKHILRLGCAKSQIGFGLWHGRLLDTRCQSDDNERYKQYFLHYIFHSNMLFSDYDYLQSKGTKIIFDDKFAQSLFL